MEWSRIWQLWIPMYRKGVLDRASQSLCTLKQPSASFWKQINNGEQRVKSRATPLRSKGRGLGYGVGKDKIEPANMVAESMMRKKRRRRARKGSRP